ncbi:MAG: DNA recombination protein RmuC [Bacteroidota bacterium]
MPDFTTIVLLIVLGILVGFLFGWLLAKMKFGRSPLPDRFDPKDYIHKSVFQNIENQLLVATNELKEKNGDLIELEKILATRERDILYLEEKIKHWQKDFDQLNKQAHTQFENIANRILEQKTKKFTDHNERQLNDLLQPLRENLKDFGRDIERRFTEEAKDKISLKKEIEHLRDLNMQLSNDAQLLASALKGDAKIQGDWGELQLELLLEKAGLKKNTHYRVQPSFKDIDGQDRRPDFIINLQNGLSSEH